MPKSDFNKSCFTTLLKSHFGMGFLLKICCMFSEHLFLGAASVYSCFLLSIFKIEFDEANML